jgi:Anthranilate phosphoribosyltransferase
MDISNIKNKLIYQNNLTSDESFLLFNAIMNGEVNEIDTSAILISLKIKGETKDEILGAAKIMRSKSLKLQVQTILLIRAVLAEICLIL